MKTLLTSKTFWLNVLGTAVQVAPVLGPMIPQPYGILVLGLLNVLNRYFLTSEPINTVL